MPPPAPPPPPPQQQQPAESLLAAPPRWGRLPALRALQLREWRLDRCPGGWGGGGGGGGAFDAGGYYQLGCYADGNDNDYDVVEALRKEHAALLRAAFGGGGGGGGGGGLAAVTALELADCSLDLESLGLVLDRLPALERLSLDGAEFKPMRSYHYPAGGGGGGGGCAATAAAELIAAGAPRLAALSAPGLWLSPGAAAALAALPRLRELEAAGVGDGGYDPDHESAWPGPPTAAAAAAWAALPAAQLRSLDLVHIPPCAAPFDGWSRLVELRGVSLDPQQAAAAAAGLPRLRLLAARPRGDWRAAAAAGAAAFPRLAHAEFWECGGGFAGARLAELCPSLEHLLVWARSPEWGAAMDGAFAMLGGGGGGGCGGGGGGGGCGGGSGCPVDLSGLTGLRSLALHGGAALGPRGWAAVTAMPRLLRLACRMNEHDAAGGGGGGGAAESGGGGLAKLLGAAAGSVEVLELDLAYNRPSGVASDSGTGGAAGGFDLAALLAAAAALPRLRALSIEADRPPGGGRGAAAGLAAAAALTALRLDCRRQTYDHVSSLLWRPAAAPLRELYVSDTGLSASGMWRDAEGAAAARGLALRRAREWAAGPGAGPYACGWRPYCGWEAEEAGEPLPG
ncbi:MAG: hypothetical protein J3K34DRAFT_467095 [Monoraphidium minutum]|nr:MAG: hypothetical protein J3K34DRAFT_467095 [Monoraphidium minutum]